MNNDDVRVANSVLKRFVEDTLPESYIYYFKNPMVAISAFMSNPNLKDDDIRLLAESQKELDSHPTIPEFNNFHQWKYEFKTIFERIQQSGEKLSERQLNFYNALNSLAEYAKSIHCDKFRSLLLDVNKSNNPLCVDFTKHALSVNSDLSKTVLSHSEKVVQSNEKMFEILFKRCKFYNPSNDSEDESDDSISSNRKPTKSRLSSRSKRSFKSKSRSRSTSRSRVPPLDPVREHELSVIRDIQRDTRRITETYTPTQPEAETELIRKTIEALLEAAAKVTPTSSATESSIQAAIRSAMDSKSQEALEHLLQLILDASYEAGPNQSPETRNDTHAAIEKAAHLIQQLIDEDSSQRMIESLGERTHQPNDNAGDLTQTETIITSERMEANTNGDISQQPINSENNQERVETDVNSSQQPIQQANDQERVEMDVNTDSQQPIQQTNDQERMETEETTNGEISSLPTDPEYDNESMEIHVESTPPQNTDNAGQIQTNATVAQLMAQEPVAPQQNLDTEEQIRQDETMARSLEQAQQPEVVPTPTTPPTALESAIQALLVAAALAAPLQEGVQAAIEAATRSPTRESIQNVITLLIESQIEPTRRSEFNAAIDLAIQALASLPPSAPLETPAPAPSAPLDTPTLTINESISRVIPQPEHPADPPPPYDEVFPSTREPRPDFSQDQPTPVNPPPSYLETDPNPTTTPSSSPQQAALPENNLSESEQNQRNQFLQISNNPPLLQNVTLQPTDDRSWLNPFLGALQNIYQNYIAPSQLPPSQNNLSIDPYPQNNNRRHSRTSRDDSDNRFTPYDPSYISSNERSSVYGQGPRPLFSVQDERLPRARPNPALTYPATEERIPLAQRTSRPLYSVTDENSQVTITEEPDNEAVATSSHQYNLRSTVNRRENEQSDGNRGRMNQLLANGKIEKNFFYVLNPGTHDWKRISFTSHGVFPVLGDLRYIQHSFKSIISNIKPTFRSLLLKADINLNMNIETLSQNEGVYTVGNLRKFVNDHSRVIDLAEFEKFIPNDMFYVYKFLQNMTTIIPNIRVDLITNQIFLGNHPLLYMGMNKRGYNKILQHSHVSETINLNFVKNLRILERYDPMTFAFLTVEYFELHVIVGIFSNIDSTGRVSDAGFFYWFKCKI